MHKILSTELSSQRGPVSLLGLIGIVCGPHLRRQLTGTAPTQATLTLCGSHEVCVEATECCTEPESRTTSGYNDIFRTHQDVDGVGVHWYLQCTVAEDTLEDALEVTIVVDVLVGWNDALVCC